MSTGLSPTEVEDVFRRYGFALERRARLLLRDHALGEDALQELLVMLLRRGGAVRDAERPYHFLCRAMDRTCLDVLRRSKRSRETMDLDQRSDGELVAPGLDPVLRRAALEMLASLDDEDQTVAIAAFVDGLTQGEIAAELGCSRVTAHKRVASVRVRLEAFSRSDPALGALTPPGGG